MSRFASTDLAPTWRMGALRDYLALTKPSVTRMVLLTGFAGMWVVPGPLNWARAAGFVAGLAQVVAAANTLNCWLERETDRRMARTASRPLAAGRLEPLHALVFASALALLGTALLVLAAGWPTAGLAALALVLYVWAYTPLKNVTSAALLVGSVPGAAAPLLGWVAVSGRIDPGAFALFAIVYWWQLPHSIAIATMRATEYAAAGHRVLPLEHGTRVTALYASFAAAVLLPLSLLPASLGLASSAFVAVAVAAGLVYLLAALAGLRPRTPADRWARRLFVVSLVYLPALLVALVASAR